MDAYSQQILINTKKLLEKIGPVNTRPVATLSSDPILEPAFLANGDEIVKDASELLNPEIYEKFAEIVQYLIATDKGEDAILVRKLLEENLLPQVPGLKQQEHLHSGYLELIGLLKFVTLEVLPIRDISSIIREYLVKAMEMGISVDVKFQNVMDSYDDYLLGGQIAETLANAMIASESKIGNISLLVTYDGHSVPSLIGNWLKDYINFSLSGSEHKSGSMQRIQYLQKNKNIAQLSKQEQKLLVKIFKLYDWLKYGGLYVDTEDMPTIEKNKQPTVQSGFNDSTLATPLKVATTPPSQASHVNVQDILNRRQNSSDSGLLMPQAPKFPVSTMENKIEKDKQQKQEEINKKLEDLKKKIE